jgi:hypothetical protein
VLERPLNERFERPLKISTLLIINSVAEVKALLGKFANRPMLAFK